MKTVLIVAVAAALGALAAFYARGGWVYEGQWGRLGPGDGEGFRKIFDETFSTKEG